MTKGVAILAIGSSAYGAWAVNFAVSAKFHSPDVAIQLICDETNLVSTAQFHYLFSEITKIEREDFTNDHGFFFPAKAKTSLYKYFAFDHTAYFDVDAVVIKDLTPLFENAGVIYSDIQAVHNISQGNLFDQLKWAKPETIWKHFGLKEESMLPAINSSFVLIRKCEEAESVYDLARELLLTNPLPLDQYWHKWGRGKGNHADELYFNVACAKMNLIPEHLCAVYFRTILESGMAVQLENIVNGHYAIGLFGDARALHISTKDYYNRLMQNYWRATFDSPFYNKCELLLKNKIVTVKT